MREWLPAFIREMRESQSQKLQKREGRRSLLRVFPALSLENHGRHHRLPIRGKVQMCTDRPARTLRLFTMRGRLLPSIRNLHSSNLPHRQLLGLRQETALRQVRAGIYFSQRSALLRRLRRAETHGGLILRGQLLRGLLLLEMRFGISH